MNVILALDISLSRTGYSLFSNDGRFIKSGNIETNGKMSTPLRLKYIAKEMRKIKKENSIKKVLIEKGFYRFAGSTEQIFRVHGVINLLFCNVEQIEIPATTIRKIVAGRGNLKKEEFVEFVKLKYSSSHPQLNFDVHDEVDSFALGLAYFNGGYTENA